MSEIYKKKLLYEQEIDFIKCDKCLTETAFYCAIDIWCKIDNENYCLSCQKKYKVNWFESKK